MRSQSVLMVLPALTEATSPFFRPIKYSLFPPLGLAQLAAFLPSDWAVRVVDEHVEPALPLDDSAPLPDLVVIQVYITNAYRAYRIADHYRTRGAKVILGGLHVTSLPEEAAPHADHLFLGPGEQTFPLFLADLLAGAPKPRYDSSDHRRTLARIPLPRRELIKRSRYFVPNSLSVTRGCPHHCDFCYKDAFFENGRSFYVRSLDDALAEINSLPGRHLYFLDDHILGHRRFATDLFREMKPLGRLFQGAATVDSILRTDLVERAVDAGLRSIFVGFETLSESNLAETGKRQNLNRDYAAAIRRLDSLGVMINGSFVFGFDADAPDVFARTVDWAVSQGITTATFHIATPYPGTGFHKRMAAQNRLLTHNWDLYDTRHTVFQPAKMTPAQLEAGYWNAYESFYTYKNIFRASQSHLAWRSTFRHAVYSTAWKKLEPLWATLIALKRTHVMRPILEAVLSRRKDHVPLPADPSNAPRGVSLPLLDDTDA